MERRIVLLVAAAVVLAGPALANASFVAVTDAAASSATFTLARPAGTASGATLIAAIAHEKGNSLEVVAPSGWTLLARQDNGNSFGVSVFGKVATASEPASWSWTFARSVDASGGVLLYTGLAPETPTVATASGTGAAIVAPSVNVDAAGSLLVTVYGARVAGTYAPPAGMVERLDRANSHGPSVSAADTVLSAVGASGARSATLTPSGAWAAVTLALRPVLGVGFDAGTGSAAESASPAPVVRLSRAMTSPVTVSYSASGGTASAGTDYALAAGTLSFAAGQTTRTVPISVLQDRLVEGAETVVISLSSPSQGALTTATHVHTIADDDLPGATVAESGGSTRVAAVGTTDSFTVVLDHTPLSNVVLSVGSGSPSVVTAGPATLTFTPADWSTPQTVTVTRQSGVASMATVTVGVVVASSDSRWASMPPRPIVVAVDLVQLVRVDGPVEATGVASPGAWGGWTAAPGATGVPSTNWLKITNVGDVSAVDVVIDFTPSSFAGFADDAFSIPLHGNVEFAWHEDRTPGSTSPGEGTYAFGPPSADGSVVVRFTARENVIYVQYRIVVLPVVLPVQDYRAAYTVTDV